MTDFSRQLNLAALSPTSQIPGWFRDMVRLTRPAGHASEQTHWTAPTDGKSVSGDRPITLRVSIRDGYVNFYCGGQSVGKVWFGKTLRGEVHYKYLHDKEIPGKYYVGLATVETDYPEHGRLEKWIGRTHKYQGVEKLFVDRVFGANPTMIDLEAALPGADMLDKDGKRVVDAKTGKENVTAPRIDLVGLEKDPDVPGWRLVFWEAKNVKDGRIRSTATPEVIKQLKTYKDWFAKAEIKQTLCDAYYETCNALVDLNDWAKAQGFSFGDLDPAISAVAKQRNLLLGVDPVVRLLIDHPKYDERFCDEHLPKLVNADIPIHIINEGMTFALPTKAAMPRTPICK